jgi:hypothetical protein
VIKYDGTIVTEPDYDAILYSDLWQEYGIYLLNKGGKWIEKEGKSVIIGGKWGLGKNGKILIPPRYEHMKEMVESPGVFRVNSGGREINTEFMVTTVTGGYYGYVDTSGAELIKPVFTWISDLNKNNTKALHVSMDPVEFCDDYHSRGELLFALADLKGNVLTPYKYRTIGNSSSTYCNRNDICDSILWACSADVSEENRKCGYLSIDGRELNAFNLSAWFPYNPLGLSIYGRRDTLTRKLFYGFFRPDFRFKDHSFDELRPLCCGLFAAGKEKQWAMLDSGGRELTAYKYEKMGIIGYRSVFTHVKNGKKQNLLDSNGKELYKEWISTEFEFTHKFSAVVKKEGKYGIISYDGDTLTPFVMDHLFPQFYKYSPRNPVFPVGMFANTGGRKFLGKVRGGKWGMVYLGSDSLAIPIEYDELKPFTISYLPNNPEYNMGHPVPVFRYKREGTEGIIDFKNREIRKSGDHYYYFYPTQ